MEHGRATRKHEDDRRAEASKLSDHLRLEIELLESQSEQAEVEPAPRQARARSVLTVDDDADICTYVARCLKAIGFPINHAYQAADGYEALETLATDRVDLVITDVLMPRMDGLTLCERLYDNPELRHIPILLMSGEMPLEDIRRKIRQDAVGLIAKPFSGRTLRSAIDQLWMQLPPA